MEQINELLKQVHDFNLKTQAEKNAQHKRGELFNVFNILNLSTNETRTHSAFLAELLRPDGSHGMQDTFLKLFLESVTSLQDFDFKTENAKVAVEYSVGLINEDATEGGRLDILITSENKAIIIENKIYAEDQKNQLVRYDNFAKKSYNEHKLLYLTLFGSDASGYSTGNQDDLDYTSIGYNDEILKWLDLCVKESVRRPKVRETIEQYIHLIKQLTYQDMENNELIKILLADQNNISAAIQIMKNSSDFCNEIREKFIKEIKEFAKDNNYTWIETNDMSKLENDSSLKFYYQKKKGACLFIGWESTTNNTQGCYYGIKIEDATEVNEIKNANQVWSDISDSLFPFGKDYFWSKEGSSNDQRWWRWDQWPTLEAMINGSYLDFIKDNVLNDNTKNLLEEINK